MNVELERLYDEVGVGVRKTIRDEADGLVHYVMYRVREAIQEGKTEVVFKKKDAYYRYSMLGCGPIRPTRLESWFRAEEMLANSGLRVAFRRPKFLGILPLAERVTVSWEAPK